MITFLHVLVALTSIAYTTFTFITPSAGRLRASYVFVGLTLASGSYLVVTTPAQMLHACLMGLVYIGLVSIGIAGAYIRLAAAVRNYN